jgi:hypothetical protein
MGTKSGNVVKLKPRGGGVANSVHPNVEVARAVIAARLAYDPSGPASRIRPRWWVTPQKLGIAALRGILPSGRGRPEIRNTWSDETIALAVSDALVYGGLSPYRNAASQGHSACSLVAEMLAAAPQPLYISEDTVVGIWKKFKDRMPTSPEDVGAWR